MRVLGIDCGGEYTGYGVVEQDGNGTLHHIVCGAVRLNPKRPLPERLSQIFHELRAVIEEHRPEVAAVEDVFYAVNAKSALKLGQVRGVALLVASECGLPVAAYAPLAIKSAVVGYGKADKFQVQLMVTRLLKLNVPPEPQDASDALAVAICHLHTAATLSRQAAQGR
jgi:crossover junction endodeoxyribonuclease RuvC